MGHHNFSDQPDKRDLALCNNRSLFLWKMWKTASLFHGHVGHNLTTLRRQIQPGDLQCKLQRPYKQAATTSSQPFSHTDGFKIVKNGHEISILKLKFQENG